MSHTARKRGTIQNSRWLDIKAMLPKRLKYKGNKFPLMGRSEKLGHPAVPFENQNSCIIMISLHPGGPLLMDGMTGAPLPFVFNEGTCNTRRIEVQCRQLTLPTPV